MKRICFALLLLGQLAWAKPVFETKKIEEAHKATKAKPAYALSVAYPACPAGLALAQREVAAFHKDFQELAENRGDGIDCSLDMNYSLVYSGPTLISVFFEGSSFLGGAHPSVLQRALLVTPQGGSVDLASCFRPGDGWLKALRDYCRPQLRKRKLDGDGEWLNKGTDATRDNYKVVLPQAKGLLVVFTDYQVCSHAEGPQQVVVPYSAVKTQINPQGRLAFALR